MTTDTGPIRWPARACSRGRRVVARAAALLLCAALVAPALSACAAMGVAANPGPATRAKVYDRYWDRLERDYPFFEMAGVDPRAHREAYRSRVVGAPGQVEYLHALAGMFGELRDPHVKILVDESWYRALGAPVARPAIGTMWIDRRLYLVSWPSSMNLRPKVRPGANFGYPELVSVEGYPADFSNLGTLLLGEAGSHAELELEWWDGSRETATVERTRQVYDPRLTRPMRASGGSVMASRVSSGRAVESMHLDGLSYVWLRTLSPESADTSWERLDAAIHHALGGAEDSDALVLDLTRNGGGDVRVLKALLARFIRAGALVWLGDGPGGQNFTLLIENEDRAGRPMIHTPVVIITDRYTGSAAEHLAAVMQRERRATVVGARTLGAEAMIKPIRVEDGIDVEIGVVRLTDASGRGIQAVGVSPDVEIDITLAAMERVGATEARTQARRARLLEALEIVGEQERYEELAGRLARIGYPDLR
jgi:hypothetical protein